MSQSLRAFAAIMRTTIIEAIQEPAALLVMLAAVIVTLLAPLFHFHAFGEEGRLARDGGLAAMLVFGLALGCATAGSAIHRECLSGTAAAALAKPVGRGTFIMAKAAGVVAVCAIFWVAAVTATMLAEAADARTIPLDDTWAYIADTRLRQMSLLAPALALALAALLHNRRRARFGSAAFSLVPLLLVAVAVLSGFWTHAGRLAPYAIRLNLNLPGAAVPLFGALALLACWSVALAVRLPTGAVLLAGTALLGIGLTADSWSAGAAAWSWRGLLAGALPNLQHYWLADALARGGRVPPAYVLQACLNAATGCALALTTGYLLLRERDLG